tara:strand:- start:665 stop:1027 length:363 start_codon:yes stop_codon:yes gene_type:complete
MKKIFSAVLLGLFASCASPNRSLYDTANALYGASWIYIGTITVYPDVIYSDKITAAAQTREIVLHDGLISYEKMLYEARKTYGDSVTIANIRIYSEEFKTKWFGRNSDVQALVDVIYVTK